MNTRVILQGGLGNQLFQLVEALRLSQVADVTLDVTALDAQPPAGVAVRQFSLEPIAAVSSLRVTRVCLPPALYRAAANRVTLHGAGSVVVRNRRVITGSCIGAPLNRLAVHRLLRLIDSAFDLPFGDWPEHQAVHVRLGDYKNLESIYGPVSKRYYGVAAAVAFDKALPVAVFSDDPGEASSLLNGWLPEWSWRPAACFDWPLLSSDPVWQDLLAMAVSRSLVAANSTFSWWAALLRGIWRQDGRTVAPRVMAPTGLMCPDEAIGVDW